MEGEFAVTREKHLDHMVRVVPFIVCAYAVQCYFIVQMGPIDFALDGLLFLGGCLISMICGFITYDLTHVVSFQQDHLTIEVKWLGHKKSIAYTELIQVEVSDPGQSFSTLKLELRSGKKYGFYFIDDADKIKKWLEQKRLPEMQAAA